jgi:hypothetical protein
MDEPLLGQASQSPAQIIGRRNQYRVELVERGRASSRRTAPLGQEDAKLLALATAARHAQALAGDDPACRQRGVDQIILAATPLTPPRPLTLMHHRAAILEEARQASAIAAAALDAERGFAKPTGPRPQPLVAGTRRSHGHRVHLPTEPIQRHRDVPLLVRVHANCHRPPGHVASPHRLGDRPGQGCVGQTRKLLSGHRPVEPRDGGRLVHFKASLNGRQLDCGSSRRRVALSATPRTDAPAQRRYTAWLSHAPGTFERAASASVQGCSRGLPRAAPAGTNGRWRRRRCGVRSIGAVSVIVHAPGWARMSGCQRSWRGARGRWPESTGRRWSR